MDSASIQITGKIISEQDGISLFKIGHKKHRVELPKVDRGRDVILDWPLWLSHVATDVFIWLRDR